MYSLQQFKLTAFQIQLKISASVFYSVGDSDSAQNNSAPKPVSDLLPATQLLSTQVSIIHENGPTPCPGTPVGYRKIMKPTHIIFLPKWS